jgi:hypothetical protein
VAKTAKLVGLGTGTVQRRKQQAAVGSREENNRCIAGLGRYLKGYVEAALAGRGNPGTAAVGSSGHEMSTAERIRKLLHRQRRASSRGRASSAWAGARALSSRWR